MRPLRQATRPLSAILAIAFAVLGWIETSAGRLAFATIVERDHLVSFNLEDGHLDLVLAHSYESPSPVTRIIPVDPSHVVHLCGPTDGFAAPRNTHLRGLDGPLGPVVATSFGLPSANAPRAVPQRPPLPASLLLARNTTVLVL